MPNRTMIQQTNAERIRAAMKAQEAEARATATGIRGMEGLGKKTLDSAIAMGKLGGAMLGLSSAQGVVSIFVEQMQRAKEYATKTSDAIQDIRDNIRELQALRGELGVTGPGISHVFDVASKTLQKPEEVQAMESAGLGVGELAIGKTISKANFDRAMQAAGKMQSLEGGDAGAYGQLMGQIALQAEGKLTPEEAEGKLNRLFQIQQPGGFKTMSQAIGQYGKSNPLVSNKVMSPEEAMGLLSAMSVNSPDEAATQSQQFTRAILAGRLKARGMAVGPDVDFEKTSDYMKGLGITDKDGVMSMGKKIADDLAKNTGQGKQNAHDYLLTHGFGNQEDRLAIMSYAGLRNTGRLEKIEAAMNAPLDNGAISRRFNERMARDPFFARRAAELSEKAAISSGARRSRTSRTSSRSAYARLKAQGKVSGSYDEPAEHIRVEPAKLVVRRRQSGQPRKPAHPVRAGPQGWACPFRTCRGLTPGPG